MKVLCINNSDPLNPHLLFEVDWIYEGEVYTIMQEVLINSGLLSHRFVHLRKCQQMLISMQFETAALQ